MSARKVPRAPTTARQLTEEERSQVKRLCRNKKGESLAVALCISTMVRQGNYFKNKGDKIIAQAREGHVVAQKALNLVVAQFLDGGGELPSSLRTYITDQLKGKIKAREGRGRTPHTNVYRDYMIT